MYLSHRVEELVNTTADTRRAIGQFVLEERAHLGDFSIGEVAELTFTSKASVSRFAQALGYTGWRSFLRAFLEEEAYAQRHLPGVDPNFPFSQESGDEAIIHAIADLQIEAITDTLRTLDRGMLGRAVTYLARSRSVWLFGISPNSYIGELFCRKLLSIGKRAHVVSPMENGIAARSLAPEDCAILVSYSGDNPEEAPMSCVPVLKARKVPIVSITSEGHNYLRHSVPCTLTMTSRENLYAKIGTFATEQSLLYVLNVLFSLYFATDYQGHLQHKVDAGTALEVGRKSVAAH